jgi:1-acylglycerone phosphate reductase
MLINNAGRYFVMPLDANIDNAKQFFDVNFWSVLAVTQVVAHMIIKARGTIVDHSSIFWNLPIPWGGMYSTSKAAVKQLSEVLHVELEPLGVRVVTALIGQVETSIFTNSHSDPLQTPPDSYYEPARQFIENQRDSTAQPQFESVDITARNLVNDILGGARGCIWRGRLATTAKWLSIWLPSWALEIITNGTKGLKEFRSHCEKSVIH